MVKSSTEEHAMNAIDDIRIRAGVENVTDAEALAVIQWCQEWYEDSIEIFVDAVTEEYAGPATISLPALLRGCDKHIEGGIAFVLADVRRCASV
jgi:hypothetical protein